MTVNNITFPRPEEIEKCSEDNCEVFDLCKWRVGLEVCNTLSSFTSGSTYVQLDRFLQPDRTGSKEVKPVLNDSQKRICLRFKKFKKVQYTGKRERMLRPISKEE